MEGGLYELIEHTADIGIRVKGSNLKELFKNAALAMFDIIAEKKSSLFAKASGDSPSKLEERRRTKIKNHPSSPRLRGIVLLSSKSEGGKKSKRENFMIKQKAENLEELFVNWLNELLSLSAIKEKIFCDFKFKNLDEHNLEIEISGCDIKDYKINTEIKAATYHELKLTPSKNGWQAEVIFDV